MAHGGFAAGGEVGSLSARDSEPDPGDEGDDDSESQVGVLAFAAEMPGGLPRTDQRAAGRSRHNELVAIGVAGVSAVVSFKYPG